MRRYQAHPVADWMWGPDEARYGRLEFLVAVAVGAVLFLAGAGILAIGGLIGAAFGWDMGPVR